MPDHNENLRRGPLPPALPEPFARPVPAVRFHQLLYGLFFYPDAALAMVVRCYRPFRALMTLALICILCGAFIGVLQIPRLSRAAEVWGDWLADEVGEIWVADGRLRWARPEELPHTRSFNGWRIDFVADDTPFEPVESGIADNRGVWISSAEVFLWFRALDGTHKRLPILAQREEREGFNMKRILNEGTSYFAPSWHDGSRLAGPAITAEARKLVRQVAPAVVFYNSAAVLFQVLIYTFILAMLAMVFRGPLAVNGFPGVLTFHLYAAIPPVIAASVYAGFRLPYLDLSTCFVAAFVVYLALTFARMRRAMAQNRPPVDEDF